MQFFVSVFIGLLLSVSVGAESLLEGRVRLESGEPAAGVQVRLFDRTKLHQSVTTTTDETGHFTLSLRAFTPGSALPQGFTLGPNYPNPFNPSTIIPYQIPTATHVRLEVFNVLGQRLATLVDAERPAGAHTAQWTATDATGRAVGAGVYIYRLVSGGATVSRRMVLIDGQAGMPAAAGPMPTSAAAHSQADARVYGLTVSGAGVVAYVDPAFRVGVDEGEIVLEAASSSPRMKRAAGGILGDVTNDGQVDAFDALYVALYSKDPSITLPNNGDISLGDVNADGTVDLADALILAAYSVNPSDPSLPAGIGGDGDGDPDVHGNTRATATPLPLDSSLDGQVKPDVDYFRVEVSDPGLLLVYTTGSLDTKGTLEDSIGTALATNDDSGSGNNFKIAHAVSAGTYYVKVEGAYSSSTGSYTIHASVSSRATAPLLALDGSLAGQIEPAGDVDYFRVEVSDPGLLLVYTTGRSRTKGTLEDSTGTALATDDDGGSGDNLKITHSVSAGTYYVKVQGDYSSSTGSYTIHASVSSSDEGEDGDSGDDEGDSGDDDEGEDGDSGDDALVMAPGAEREYTRSFPASFGYVLGENSPGYRIASSDIDDGLLGLPDVEVSISESTSTLPGSPEIRYQVHEVKFSYNLGVSQTIPLGTTLRATIVYEITLTPLPPNLSKPPRIVETYTVSLVVVVSNDGSSSAKVIAGDPESSQQVRVQGSLSPASAILNRKQQPQREE